MPLLAYTCYARTMKNTAKKITLESLDAKIDAKVDALDAKIDTKVDEVRHEMREGFRGVKVMMEQMDKKWDLVAEQYHDILKRLRILEDRSLHQAVTLSEMKVDIRLLKNEVSNMAAQLSEKIGRKEFSELQRRVLALENRKK